MKFFNFSHHFFVDGETTGGINNDYISEALATFFNSILGDINRLLIGVTREELGFYFAGQGF